MDKRITASILVFLSSGCAIVTKPTGIKEVTVTLVEPGPLPGATLGMKRADVARLLDREVMAGYEQDSATGEFRPIRVRSLYSTEILEVNGITYQVDSYITADLKSGAPGERDLLPLIYQNDILVGKGQAELDALQARAAR